MNTVDLVAKSSMTALPNFPVMWADPADANLFWTLDRMHWPTPITPMTGQHIGYMFQDGFNRASQIYELPIRAYSQRINTYHYNAVAPLALSAEEMASQGQRAEQKLGEAMQDLAENWNDQYLPEIKQHLAYWEDFNLPAALLPALLAHLDETIARVKRIYEIHFLVYFPFVLAPSLFEELYSDLFGSQNALEAYRLLQGIDHKTLAADRALWQLSRQALAMPSVRQILQQQATNVISALETASEGRNFLAGLRTFLDEYGQRNDKSNELDTPHWVEDPTPVIQRLREYIMQPNRDLAADLAAQVTERERLLAETRTQLQSYPQPVVDQFEFLLKAAQAGVFVGEDHSYWIDQRVTYQVRRVMLEFGRHFAAARVLDQADDVFQLTFDEVRSNAERLPHLDQRHIVAGRRAELAYFRTIQPPPTLGTPPPGPPPDDPVSRAIGRFFGFGELQPTNDSNSLRGHAGSPGVARGPASVVRSLAEAGKLQAGDVLVAETTMPAWTPLFAIAAAIVTDTGGVLSHCAVVAREYGIPAVVGVGVATGALRDGQIVEVDGSAGVVRIVG